MNINKANLIDGKILESEMEDHLGEVTGGITLVLDKTAITNKTTVTPVGTDYVLISDTSDSGNLKKVLVSDLGGGLSQQQIMRLI